MSVKKKDTLINYAMQQNNKTIQLYFYIFNNYYKLIGEDAK